MQPIVNMPEEDRATDIGNMHKNLVKMARVVLEISSRTDRQMHKHTDRQAPLITILRHRQLQKGCDHSTLHRCGLSSKGLIKSQWQPGPCPDPCDLCPCYHHCDKI